MRYDEFESEFPEVLRQTNPATVRSWKKRGSVPDSVARQAQALQSPVAEVPDPVAKPESVAKSVASGVAVASAEKGHPEFDIMDDGWARGFPGDVVNPTNRTYRTAHAIRRFCERDGGDEKALTQEFWESHAGSVESRLAFFTRLDARRQKSNGGKTVTAKEVVNDAS